MLVYKKYNLYFVIFLLQAAYFFGCYNILAQDKISFENITVKDGLPESSVRKIIQDYQGFLWFGTQNGLVRYDGYKFKRYNFDPDDSNSIGGRMIYALFEDQLKNIWIGTEFGFSRFDRVKDSFENYTLNDSIIWGNFTFSEDYHGYLYIVKGKGLVRFDKVKKTYTRFLYDSLSFNSISSNSTSSIIKFDSAIMFIGTIEGGLNKFDINSQTFRYFKNIPGDKNSLSSNKILSLHKSKAGKLWIGTDKGLNKFEPSDDTFSVYGIPELSGYDINSICEDNFGNIWLAVFNYGLLKFDPFTYKFTKYEFDDKRSFNNTAYCLFTDRSGIIWIGTLWSGLFKFDNQKSQFQHYSYHINNESQSVLSLIKDVNGYFWVGTANGLYKFDIKTNTYINFQKMIGNRKLNNERIKKLFIDSYGYFWIGTIDGLHKYDFRDGSLKIYKNVPGDEKSISGNDIWDIFEDSKRNMWFGTTSGLNFYERQTENFKQFMNDPYDSTTVSFDNVLWVYEDKYNNFWVGTNLGGLNKLDQNTNIFTHYNYPKKGFNSVYEFLEDRKDRFWVASYMGGLHLFDRNSGEIKSITEKDGLINNTIQSIKEDRNGNIWMSTDNGISRYDPESGKIKNFDKNDLHVTRFLPAGMQDEFGNIYFGGEGGFVKFHPDSMKENSKVPQIVLTDFLIFNQSVRVGEYNSLLKNINVADEIVLTHDQNVFSFEFAALDFHVSGRNQYAYMLKGFDNDWRYSGTDHTAHFTNIDPGEYIFRVKGSNNDGIWNEEGVSVKVIITPPWWGTWWFRTSAVLMLLGIFGGSVRYVTIQRIKRELALEMERSRISRDMHDEVGSNLTKISILSEITKQNISNPDLARSNVEKISESASEVVDNISEIIWAINPRNDTLDNMIAYMREYTSETLDLKQIECEFEIPDKIPDMYLSSEVRRNTFLVIKELLNNIIKYSQATKVDINVLFPDSKMEILIRDNGTGFSLDNVRKFGNGLHNMEKRMEDIDGEFTISSELTIGTKYAIKIKNLKQNSFL